MNGTTSRTTGKVNVRLVISRIVTIMFMIGTASVSFYHIVSVSRTLGLAWEAWSVPFLVDGIAVLGLVGRSPRLAKGTRSAGLFLVCVGGALSLTCNVMAGHNVGQKAYGVLIVGGFMLTEWYAGRLQAAPAPEPRPGRRCEPGCTCGKHARSARKPARKPVQARKPRAPKAASLVDLEAAYALPSAPVSPAA